MRFQILLTTFCAGLILISCSYGQTKMVLPDGVSPQTMFRCSFKDKSGNLWFGTTGAGVYKYDGIQFIRYAETEGLTDLTVYSIGEDSKGTIWVGTEHGVFSGKEGKFTRLEIPHSDHFVRHPQVYCVLGDQKGNIWFGTESQGLWRYSETGFTNFRCADSTWNEVKNGEEEQNGAVNSLAEDRNGNIWINLTAAGLNYYDGNSFHRINGEHSKVYAFQMMGDRIGNLWIMTLRNGVCRLKPGENTIESITQKEGILRNYVSCFFEGKDGTIWFGSLGSGAKSPGGLSKFDGKTVTPIPTDGMRNRIVWTVLEDDSGNIWIGTKEFGLYRYDGKSLTEFTAFQ
ncbi:MAG: ligand-binding sensor domain-containing protein [Fluviicola sp.]